MGALAMEYAETMLHAVLQYKKLEPSEVKLERAKFLKEAEEIKSGCETHFIRSAVKLASNTELIPSEDHSFFMQSCYRLISSRTTVEEYHEIMSELRRRFPKIKWWLNWWQRPAIASMIFPARSEMDRQIAGNIPRTSNPVEHQHSLLHHAVGTHHDLLTGIKKIYAHVHELELQYKAINGV